MTHHVVSLSGGKDSTAVALLALEQAERAGIEPMFVFADTGHEHPLTYEFVDHLEHHLGTAVQWVRAEFSQQIARKRNSIGRRWTSAGVPPHRIAQAVALLQPTGIPFLDLCLWKGRFPSARRRFCSEELKWRPIYEQAHLPLMRSGRVLSWQGIRADESLARSQRRRFERADGRLWAWRPILCWTAADVFALHRRHGLRPNPLYTQGMGRVGCMPCIHARKAEVAEIARRFPAEVERVAEWERLVGAASRRGLSSFFAHDKIPGDHQGRRDIPMPGIKAVAEWARTGRGGRQFDLFLAGPGDDGCSSLYGLCEAA